jgi:hypothetical protein
MKYEDELTNLLGKLNIEIAQYRLNMLKKPLNKRVYYSDLRRLLHDLKELNKNFETDIIAKSPQSHPSSRKA